MQIHPRPPRSHDAPPPTTPADPLLLALAGGAAAQVVFYENKDFGGRSLRADDAVPDLGSSGFNDRASSIRVEGGRWQVCQNSSHGGQEVEGRRGDARLPGDAAGGVLGHQAGGDGGRDPATVAGVVVGAAVDTPAGRARHGPQRATQDVQRCADAPGPRRSRHNSLPSLHRCPRLRRQRCRTGTH